MTSAPPLRIGVDVPWVTTWSSEPMTGIGPCPSVDGAIAVAQLINPGVGEPHYKRNHLFRQRKAVREMLCPMCGEATAKGNRWSQTGHWTTAGELRARDLNIWIPQDMADDHQILDCGTIPPLHWTCAQRSRSLCPRLHDSPDQEIKAFPEAWILANLAVEAREKPGFSNVPKAPVQAITFLQIFGVPDY